MLAISGLSQGFTIYSPIALIGEDPQVTSIVHQALKHRFKNIVIRDSLESARLEASQEGGPEIAILATSSRDSGAAAAYGVALPNCQVSLTVQILRLPSTELEISLSADGKGPDCAAAFAVASAGLSDPLIKSLEEYRRRGTVEVESQLWVELAGTWSSEGKSALGSRLAKIPGIRNVGQTASDERLVLAIYRQPEALARDMDRLDGVRVTRFSEQQVTLAPSTYSAKAELSNAETDRPLRLPPKDKDVPPSADGSQAAPLSSSVGQAYTHGGRKWALVVGISEFADPAVPPLNFPDHDAEAFATVLKDPAIGRFAPENVVLLLNEEATTRRLKMELDHLARISRPEDLFLFYISTHAVPGQLDAAGDAYLVLHDTEKLNLYATGLPMRELVDALSHRIRARSIVSFLDACNTGQILKRTNAHFVGMKRLEYEATARVPGDLSPGDSLPGNLSWAREWKALTLPAITGPPAATDPSPTKKIVLISSSDGDQPSWESELLGHGFFTYYLIEILKEARGMANVGTLFNDLRQRVKHAVEAEKGVLQEPRMFFNQDVDIVVGYEPQD